VTYQTILYETEGAIATISLNRPERLNTIVPPMPDEIEAAVIAANHDPELRVIVLRGLGRSFCAGFDFGEDFAKYGAALATEGRWDPGKDMIFTTSPFAAPVPKFMSLWRSPKPPRTPESARPTRGCGAAI
jgi:enoyl-CoA hydratase